MKWIHADLPASLEGLHGLEDCHVYDLTDGKALYLMLDHSHWQCNNHPYLLCKFNSGDHANCEGIISDEEYHHMDPTEKAAARLYMLFKVHKAHQEGTAPPERPVISGSGSITENPSRFGQHYMKQVSKDHDSFIRDTCDFLRHIQSIDNLPPNSVLVTIDVTGLYTHIPRDEGIKATREALDRRKDKSVPTALSN